jgi:hypothetical protein
VHVDGVLKDLCQLFNTNFGKIRGYVVQNDELSDTVKICIECKGEGIIIKETSTIYNALKCLWCDGSGILSDSQYKTWKNSRRY